MPVDVRASFTVGPAADGALRNPSRLTALSAAPHPSTLCCVAASATAGQARAQARAVQHSDHHLHQPPPSWSSISSAQLSSTSGTVHLSIDQQRLSRACVCVSDRVTLTVCSGAAASASRAFKRFIFCSAPFAGACLESVTPSCPPPSSPRRDRPSCRGRRPRTPPRFTPMSLRHPHPPPPLPLPTAPHLSPRDRRHRPCPQRRLPSLSRPPPPR